MTLAQLLSQARPLLEQTLFDDPPPVRDAFHPACVLFFSITSGKDRAHVQISRGKDFPQAWQAGAQALQQWATAQQSAPCWLRVDVVHTIEAMPWGELRERLARTKRNYFRFGLALTADFSLAVLEQELGANAILYDNQYAVAHPNAVNLAAYGKRRFAHSLMWPQSDTQQIWRFTTRAIFTDGRAIHAIEHEGRNSGYRKVQDWGPDRVLNIVQRSTAYLSRQVKKTGQYHYGWFPCFDRAIPTYNALRHASSTYSMLEGWELTQDDSQLQAIERSLDYLSEELIKHVDLPDGTKAAFVVDLGNEIKLGANGVALLAFCKHAELLGERRNLPLMAALARGIAHMQDPETGSFVHVLNYPDLSLKARHRIIYYDGEAAFSLMRLYGITRDARWLRIVEHAFQHFIAARHWEAHDHWLSYAVNELTLYRPEEKYYRFGLDNVSGHLDFVLERVTTYPTLLELMMAARRMIERIQQDQAVAHLLDGFDLGKFHRALEHRARYLLNGFFWPELAMFFKNPARIEDGFFIRHHTYRVRIDDVEHYLSGFVAYWKFLKDKNGSSRARALDAQASEPAPMRNAVVAWGGDVNLGRRQHYRTAELGVDKVLNLPALHEVDLRIVNLECVVSTLGEQGADKGEGGPFYYRARPEMLQVLKVAGIDVVCTANNHAGDYGHQALLHQGRLLAEAGIRHAGSGLDRNAALTPAMHRAGELSVAVFSLDFMQPHYSAEDNQPGTAYFAIDAFDRIASELTPRIAQARKRADVVFVAVHWGKYWAEEPEQDKVRMGRFLVDSGADAVLGASSHVLQGVEVYKNRPIIYDAGNLLMDSVNSDFPESGVFQLELERSGVRLVRFVPVRTGFGFSEQPQGQQAVLQGVKYAQACAALGTLTRITADGCVEVVVEVPARDAVAPPSADGQERDPVTAAQASGLPVPPDWQVDSVPENARIDPVRIGPLLLLGLAVRPQCITRRGMLWVESFWMADEEIDKDLRIDMRAVPVSPSSMPPWGQGMDHDPCDWMMPTSRWEPGKVYRDFYGLRPPRKDLLADADLRINVRLVGPEQEKTAFRSFPGLVRVAMSAGARKQTALAESRTSALAQPRDADALARFLDGKWLARPPASWRCQDMTCALDEGVTPGSVIALELLAQPVHEGNITDRFQEKKVSDGAVILTNRPELAGHLKNPVLLVSSTTQAVQKWLHEQRSRYRGTVFTIAGSVGKTTTSNMLSRMLARYGSVLVGKFNSNMTRGVFESAVKMHDQDFALFEVAVGGLPRVPPVVRSHVALFISLFPAHMQYFASLEDVAMRKASIFSGAPDGAAAVICRDVPHYEKIEAEAVRNRRTVLTYGKSSEAIFRLLKYDAGNSHFEFSFGSEVFRVRQGALGEHVALNMLATIVALHAAGLDWRAELGGMWEQCTVPVGRGNVSQGRVPGGSCTVLDHAYNANPGSMAAAMRTLAEWPASHGRRVAVLSDMLEMGGESRSYHAQLSEIVQEAQPDLLLLAGSEMGALAEALPKTFPVLYFPAIDDLMPQLRGLLKPGDVVMFKGSNATGLGQRMRHFFRENGTGKTT